MTADFDSTSRPSLVVDFSEEWPFGPSVFDFMYLSHVIEHLYPEDRDRLIRNVYRSCRPGGFVLIRVPHRSSAQATGWEHYTFYGLNGVTSLCHGYNPTLPMFRSVSVGVALSIDFKRMRSTMVRLAEGTLNKKFRLTDQLLSKMIGGIAEVQFMLQRLPTEIEVLLRADMDSGYAN